MSGPEGFQGFRLGVLGFRVGSLTALGFGGLGSLIMGAGARKASGSIQILLKIAGTSP